MTIRERYEAYRQSIGSRTTRDVTPEEMACEEISDAQLLCANPEVSVVVVVYRAEKTIAKTLESFLEQRTTFPFEVIVSDDASPDKTLEICKEYQKRYPDKLRVLWSERNVGLHVNDARAKARARGVWMAECDGDDNWTNLDKLQLQYDAVHRENAQFCVTHYYTKNVNTGERWETQFPKKRILTARDFEIYYFQTNTFFYSRALYERIVRETPLGFSGDYSKAACLAGAGKAIYLPETTAVWHVGEGSFSGGTLQQRCMTCFFARLGLYLYGPRAVRGLYARNALRFLRAALNPSRGATKAFYETVRGWAWDGAWRLWSAARFSPSATAFFLLILWYSLRLRGQKA